MKTGYNIVGNSMVQKLTNAGGRISTQFMSGDVQKESLSVGKKALEESVRMEGYDVNVNKSATGRIDVHQPMTGYSEFWIG